jgi:lysozyme
MNVGKAIEVAGRLCLRWEGMRLSPYLCPAGIPTIGVGATYYEDGRKVTLADPPITKERALALLHWHLTVVYLPAVMQLCPEIDTPERLAAITDFTFNVGVDALKNSRVRKYINAGQWGEVKKQLTRWVHGGGRVQPGLVSRRQVEIQLIG